MTDDDAAPTAAIYDFAAIKAARDQRDCARYPCGLRDAFAPATHRAERDQAVTCWLKEWHREAERQRNAILGDMLAIQRQREAHRIDWRADPLRYCVDGKPLCDTADKPHGTIPLTSITEKPRNPFVIADDDE